MNARRDITRKAEGETTKTVIPTDAVVPTERKFAAAITNTTDKMGLTTAGAITKGVWWGFVIGVGVIIGVGMWKNKINISYTK